MVLDTPLVARRAVDQLTANIPDGPTIRRQLQEFLRNFAQQSAEKLEVLTFSGADVEAAAGVNLAAEARRVYALVFWKATDTNYAAMHFYNDNTTPFDDGSVRTAVGLAGPDHSTVVVDPLGMAYASGVSAASQTSIGGSTASPAGQGPSGFVIVGEL